MATYHVDNWTVRVKFDRFTGEHACKISRGEVSYGRGYTTFQLPKGVDAFSATYKVDNGPAKTAIEPVEDVETVNMKALGNPSQGRVRLPTPEILDAERVQIRIAGQHQVRVFKVAGLRDALAFAQGEGCAD